MATEHSGSKNSTISQERFDQRQDSQTIVKESSRKVAPVPERFKNTFFVLDPNITEKKLPYAIAEHIARGHKRVQNQHEAHFVWAKFDDLSGKVYGSFEPWQRHNHIPGKVHFDNKSSFAEEMKKYGKKTGRNLPYLPKTFPLHDEAEVGLFLEHLDSDQAKQQAWVLKESWINLGAGLTLMGPNSKELKALQEELFQGGDKYKRRNYFLVQEYICNGLLFEGRQKFDVRMYWLVASIEPLIVLFEPGIGRALQQDYTEKDFSNTKMHISNLHQGARAVSWSDVKLTIRNHYEAHKQVFDQRLSPQTGGDFDPVVHVYSQMKAIVADITDAFRDKSFSLGKLTSENGFSILGIDLYIDNDLDVFVIEPQCHPSLQRAGEPHRSNIVVSETIDIVAEVHEKQSRGLPILPLEKTGDFELVYDSTSSFHYSYDYQRLSEKKGCVVSS